jgi:hypothetical protein
MVGINTYGIGFPDLDIFNCLALDPYTNPIASFVSFSKRLRRVSLKVHLDKL